MHPKGECIYHVFIFFVIQRKFYLGTLLQHKLINSQFCIINYTMIRGKNCDNYAKYYKDLLRENGLPDITFHKLRSTYTTILLINNFRRIGVYSR